MSNPDNEYDRRTYNRLFSKTNMRLDGCLEFIGQRDTGGYGRLRYKGSQFLAHKLAFFLCVDDIPAGICILHSCDNRWCVNPEHLRLGTQQENIQDMLTRRGPTRGKALVDEDEVLFIRFMSSMGVRTETIANEFNLAWSSARAIINRTTWNHI